MCTKIGSKWINNIKIVPEDGVASNNFGYDVPLSGSTALFGDPLIGEGNRGSE